MDKEKRLNMWRTILSDKIATKHGITPREALDFINKVILEIDESIKEGHQVKIPNFGVFFMNKKKERMARNPKTRDPHKVSARSVGCLRYSRVFKETVKIEVKA